jgi:riboflavin biosynthesis pyrimidine reductase
VVFDTAASLAGDSSWPAPGREFVVVAGANAEVARVRALEARGARVLLCALDGERVSVADALEKLAGIGFTRILVEGGPQLFESFVRADAWDALWHYQSMETFGGGVAMMSAATRARLHERSLAVDETTLGPDLRRRFTRAKSWQRLTERLAERVEGAGRVHGHR